MPLPPACRCLTSSSDRRATLPDHLQAALEFRHQYAASSPEFRAIDALIDVLIENCTFTYANVYENQRFINGKGATQ
jgi:hypothetical protein